MAKSTIYMWLHNYAGRQVRLWHGDDAPGTGRCAAGDIWANTAEYGGVPHIYNGTAWPSRGVWEFGYDSAAYFTITQSDGGGVAFASVSDGTAGFTFSNPIAIAPAALAGLSVGAFASAAVGSGIALGATNTAGNRFYADDGGAKIAAGAEVRNLISRMLLATADTDATDHTVEALVAQTKVAADQTIGGNLAGAVGYLEVAAGATLIGGRYAQGSVAAAVWGRVDVPATAVVGADAYVSAFGASGNLGGTHTGKASVLHIPNPGAGVWDFLFSLGSTTGCTVVNALVPAATPDATTMGADIAIKIDINGTAYYIPAYGTLHA